MELKKTTILSAFVVVAGIISEIIFRDVLSKGVSGIVISLVLAAIVFVAFYFMVDGLYTSWDREKETARQTQKEMEQKIYSVINEQLKFQKIIYSEVHRLLQNGETTSTKEESFDPSPLLSNIQLEISEDDMQRLIESVNGHSQKLFRDMQEALADASEQTSTVSKEIENAVTTINEHTSEAAGGISELVSKSGDVSEALAALDISGSIAHAAEEVNGHTNQIVQSLETQVAELNDRTTEAVNNLESQVNDWSSQTMSAVQSVETHVAEMSQQTTDAVQGLETQVAEAERQTTAGVKSLEERVAAMESQTEASIQSLESHISGIREQTTEAVQNLGSQVAGLHSQTNEAVRNLENQMADLTSQTMEAVQDLKDIVTLYQLSGELPSAPVSLPAQVTAPVPVPDMDAVAAKINENTMSAAKVIVKYIGKTTEDIKKKIDEGSTSVIVQQD